MQLSTPQISNNEMLTIMHAGHSVGILYACLENYVLFFPSSAERGKSSRTTIPVCSCPIYCGSFLYSTDLTNRIQKFENTISSNQCSSGSTCLESGCMHSVLTNSSIAELCSPRCFGNRQLRQQEVPVAALQARRNLKLCTPKGSYGRRFWSSNAPADIITGLSSTVGSFKLVCTVPP
jgi:hypothetical protein